MYLRTVNKDIMGMTIFSVFMTIIISRIDDPHCQYILTAKYYSLAFSNWRKIIVNYYISPLFLHNQRSFFMFLFNTVRLDLYFNLKTFQWLLGHLQKSLLQYLYIWTVRLLTEIVSRILHIEIYVQTDSMQLKSMSPMVKRELKPSNIIL